MHTPAKSLQIRKLSQMSVYLKQIKFESNNNNL